MGLERQNYSRYRDADAIDFFTPSMDNIFRFDKVGIEAVLYGGIGSGTALTISPGGTYPSIQMSFNAMILLRNKVGGSLRIMDGSTRSFDLSYAANVSLMAGGNVAGDDLKLKANNQEDYPFIQLFGNSDLSLFSNDLITFHVAANYIGNVALAGTGGALCLKEGTTPSAIGSYGKIYCKADNKLYFQDGAGAEHEIAFV